jgi:hypothetical protein
MPLPTKNLPFDFASQGVDVGFAVYEVRSAKPAGFA